MSRLFPVCSAERVKMDAEQTDTELVARKNATSVICSGNFVRRDEICSSTTFFSWLRRDDKTAPLSKTLTKTKLTCIIVDEKRRDENVLYKIKTKIKSLFIFVYNCLCFFISCYAFKIFRTSSRLRAVARYRSHTPVAATRNCWTIVLLPLKKIVRSVSTVRILCVHGNALFFMATVCYS